MTHTLHVEELAWKKVKYLTNYFILIVPPHYTILDMLNKQNSLPKLILQFAVSE